MADETVLQVSSGGDAVPDHPEWPLSLRPASDLFNFSSDSTQEDGGIHTATYPQTPEQAGDDLDDPPPQNARTSMQLGSRSLPAMTNFAPDIDCLRGVASAPSRSLMAISTKPFAPL